MENKRITKEEAIKRHRDMWNWIADEIEKRKHTVSITTMKDRYIFEHDIERYAYVKNNCYCCEYASNEDLTVDCDRCPLVWTSEEYTYNGYQCEIDYVDEYGEERYGLWWECKKYYKDPSAWITQADLARQIANLPEREYV